MKKTFLILLISLSLFCSGCGWQLRNAHEVPAQIKSLYLDNETYDSHFNAALLALLSSMQVHLAAQPSAAPFTLVVTRYTFSHTNPAISTTNVAITYTYTMSVTLAITDAKGKVLVPAKQITASRDITVNTNQIFTINSTTLFKEELQRDIINIVYYWLTSAQTQKLLTPVKEKHATSAKTTHPAS